MKFFIALLLFVFVSGNSWSQFIKYKEIKQMIEDNRVADKDCFVILRNGDTITGSKIHLIPSVEKNGFNGYSWVRTVKINKQKIDRDDILALQTEKFYSLFNDKKIACSRIATGKISVFMYQTFSIKYNSTTKSDEKGAPKTYFVFQMGTSVPAALVPMSYENLRNAVAQNPKALKTFDRLYPKAGTGNNGYDKFLEVVEVFNKS